MLYLIACFLTLLGAFWGCSAFSIKASPSTSATSTTSFWTDDVSVASLPDPPSAKRLRLIQASPYRRGFEPVQGNIEAYEPEIVQGAVPASLFGSLATNGPGRIRIGETQYGHWFDGDGYITVLTFENGKATFRGRYVQTERFKAQEALMAKHQSETDKDAPPLAFSGAWTRNGKGHWYENIFRIPTNPSNTATMWLGTRLYSLCEGGHPIEIDPKTLGVIRGEKPFTDTDHNKANSFFSAHFSRDIKAGNVYNHGYILSPMGPPRLNIMKISSDGILLNQQACDLPFNTFVHDSTLSQNYMVYFLPPYHIPSSQMYKFLLGLSAIANLYVWDPENLDAFVHVHSKEDLKLQWRIQLPNSSTTLYHLVDAHDEENIDGTVTLKIRVAEHVPSDRLALERQFADQYSVENGTRLYTVLREYTFCLKVNGQVVNVTDTDVCGEAALCEFPAINTEWKPGHRRQYVWTNALSDETQVYLNGIQKVNMKDAKASAVVTFGQYSYAGPPAFVPSEDATAEDDGFILTTVYRALEHRSDIVILDAATMETHCIMKLKDHVPYQFHGDYLHGFVPAQ
jgi:carotenoid cleavage dioxygenase-like enzyme